MIMIRRWWAAGLEVETIERMCSVHLQLTTRATNRLLRDAVELIELEADEYENLPDHHKRHRHRLRLENLLRVALEKGNLSVAHRCIRDLGHLDGSFKAADEDDPGIVPLRQQGARRMTNEQLAQVLTTGKELIIEVPLELELDE